MTKTVADHYFARASAFHSMGRGEDAFAEITYALNADYQHENALQLKAIIENSNSSITKMQFGSRVSAHFGPGAFIKVLRTVYAENHDGQIVEIPKDSKGLVDDVNGAFCVVYFEIEGGDGSEKAEVYVGDVYLIQRRF